MLTNGNNVNNAKVDALEASKKLMAELQARKVIVKPTLGFGHFTVVFKGMDFIETRHKSNPCMGLQVKYQLDKTEYEEVVLLDGTATLEAQQAAMGQVQRYMQQIAEQFNLVDVEITFELLNKYIGKNIDIKVYPKTFMSAKGTECTARAYGFWKRPIEADAEAAVTLTTF